MKLIKEKIQSFRSCDVCNRYFNSIQQYSQTEGKYQNIQNYLLFLCSETCVNVFILTFPDGISSYHDLTKGEEKCC
jgi:hypothetical protein